MKNTYKLLLLSLCLNLFSCIKEPDVQVPINNNLMPEHPRIMWSTSEEQKVRDAVSVSGSWQKRVHDYISTSCDAILKLPAKERVLVGSRLLQVSQEMERRIVLLSYMYRISGDMKYRDRALVEIDAACNFSDWNPSHFLDVAEMSFGIGIGYDWLYKTLPDSTRTKIVAAVRTKGIDPSYNTTYNTQFLNALSNWNLVCNGGITIAAIATMEKEADCLKIINRSVSKMPLDLVQYGPDGIYPEGYGYWIYGTTFAVATAATLEHLYGNKYNTQLVPDYFLKSSRYYENMVGSSGQSYTYSDTPPNTVLSPPMFWFAAKLNDPSLLWNEKTYLNDPLSNTDALSGSSTFLPMLLFWASNLDLTTITQPSKNSFFGRGESPLALMRTSWNNNDAICLTLKGGTSTTNHSHMDVGSFFLDVGKIRWAMDFGTENYTKIEANNVDIWNMGQNSTRWSIFRYNNAGHNTLTIDGLNQIVAGKGELTSYSDTDANFIYAVSDISSVYNGQVTSAKRGAAIVKGKYAVIRDEVTSLSTKSSVLRWNMVTRGIPVLNQANQTITLTQGTAKLILKVVSPNVNVTLKTWSTNPTPIYESPNPGTYMVGFELNMLQGSQNNIVVQLIPSGNESFVVNDNKDLSQWGK